MMWCILLKGSPTLQKQLYETHKGTYFMPAVLEWSQYGTMLMFSNKDLIVKIKIIHYDKNSTVAFYKEALFSYL